MSACSAPWIRAGLSAVFSVALEAGPVAASLMQGPNAPGAVVNDASQGGDPWVDPEHAASSDDVYAVFFPEGPGESQYLKATGFGFAIPNDATINGIQVLLEGHATVVGGAPNVLACEMRIVKGGVIGAVNHCATAGSTPGDPDDLATIGGDGDLLGETWAAADVNAADFGFAFKLTVVDLFEFVDSISITVFHTGCGDGELGMSEECDDGNAANGDCCSSTCQLDPLGAPCPDATVCNGDETCDGAGACNPGTPLDCDDASLCTQDSCDPSGGCANAGPAVGCRTALKSTLILKNSTEDARDKLVWKWIKGQSTSQAEFGVPTATTRYALCIFTGTTAASLVAHYMVPADAMKWSPVGTIGYEYKDSNGSADGITKIALKGDDQNRSKCLVKGKGAALDDVALDTLDDSGLLTVQLVNDSTSVCFESAFAAADFVTVDDPARFKAKAR